MLGKLLADSGGADQVVDRILRGRPATLPWKMALVASIIGIPMFFEIGLVLLIPGALVTESPEKQVEKLVREAYARGRMELMRHDWRLR